jgi:sulfite reductase alpha subunit-like flavoprotein
LYADEWKQYEEKLPDFEVVPCFSRYNGKVYVQDRLVQLKERIVDLMEEDAVVYTCGSAEMARLVRNELTRVLRDGKGWSDVEVERYMVDMKRSRRLQEDVWSS